jgi:hypothetical protein
MKNMSKLLIGAAIGLCASMAASAQARTLFVAVSEPTAGINLSWQQDSNPTPFVYTTGQSFAILVSHFASPGSAPHISAIGWRNAANNGGGLFSPGSIDIVGTGQVYTGSEASPIFQAGRYLGFDNLNNSIASILISPSPVPGAGLAGLAALALAGS